MSQTHREGDEYILNTHVLFPVQAENAIRKYEPICRGCPLHWQKSEPALRMPDRRFGSARPSADNRLTLPLNKTQRKQIGYFCNLFNFGTLPVEAVVTDLKTTGRLKARSCGGTPHTPEAVSYTHLTLPTSCCV